MNYYMQVYEGFKFLVLDEHREIALFKTTKDAQEYIELLNMKQEYAELSEAEKEYVKFKQYHNKG